MVMLQPLCSPHRHIEQKERGRRKCRTSFMEKIELRPEALSSRIAMSLAVALQLWYTSILLSLMHSYIHSKWKPCTRGVWPWIRASWPWVRALWPWVRASWPWVRAVWPWIRAVWPWIRAVWPWMRAVWPGKYFIWAFLG